MPAESVWPTTVAGWVALIAALTALIGGIVSWIWGYGKLVNQVNGLGGRVAKNETDIATLAGRESERALTVERLSSGQARLTGEIAEQKEAMSTIREQITDIGVHLGSKIDELVKSIHRAEVETARAIASIQTSIQNLEGRNSR